MKEVRPFMFHELGGGNKNMVNRRNIKIIHHKSICILHKFQYMDYKLYEGDDNGL